MDQNNKHPIKYYKQPWRQTILNRHTSDENWTVLKFFNSLWKHGPLGTIQRVCKVMQSVPGCRHLFLLINKLPYIVQRHLDNAFDRKYGTDTSGVIPLEDLTIESQNIKEGIWYEPMSAKVFRQLIGHLTINFSEFEFIDFGSGKGRVLILASECGFKKVIGVEFAQELHRIATENTAIYKHYTQKPSNIETVCMDAVKFPIPNAPLVIFFYSPFRGEAMERVLNNISTSFAINPREIILIFYGRNPSSIELLKATKFRCRELQLRTDWSRLTQYQGFLFTKSRNGSFDDWSLKRSFQSNGS